jgi:hypothetical protein
MNICKYKRVLIKEPAIQAITLYVYFELHVIRAPFIGNLLALWLGTSHADLTEIEGLFPLYVYFGNSVREVYNGDAESFICECKRGR